MKYFKSAIFILLLFNGCHDKEKKPPEQPAPPDEMVTADGKKEMILLTDRPPNLETPLKYFKLDYTPNDVFFVRWHLSGLPESVDSASFRLKVNGHVNKPLSLSLNDLRTKFEAHTVTALAECAGNSRSFFDPRVPGGQWKNGAMGNARWTGVSVKDVLNAAGIKPGAFEVSFNGLDEPPMLTVPEIGRAHV